MACLYLGKFQRTEYMQVQKIEQKYDVGEGACVGGSGGGTFRLQTLKGFFL